MPQEGVEFHPSAAPSYANARWRQTFDDAFNSVGFHLRWQLSARLATSLAYSVNDSTSRYRSTWLDNADTGEAAGTRDELPDWGVTTQRVEASADWQHSPRTAIKVRYLYERFDSDDFAWQDDVTVLGLGWRTPAYDGHALVVSASYHLDIAGH